MDRWLLSLAFALSVLPAGAEEKTSAQRGREALETRAFVAANWSMGSYDNVWKLWQPALKERPNGYDQAVRDYYGLHPASYDNGKLPMGLREGRMLLGNKGIAVDCMLCHGGSIFGQSYVSLGNSALDIQAVFNDFSKASGGKGQTPFVFSHVRGTSEAASMSVFLMSIREPDLSLRFKRADLGMPPAMCEDAPAWWLFKKKKTMYHTGTNDTRSARAIMQFMLTPENDLKTFVREEATFADIRDYLRTLESPKYPFPVDHSLAGEGEKVFRQNCARCHGTYGEDWSYPSKVVPIDVIGTDRNRFEGFTARAGEHYNRSWLAQDGYPVHEPVGYQAPPLDGVWATAPYFHNGSVPTIHDVLSSRTRPVLFTRSYRTDEASYDRQRVGWKVELLRDVPGDLSAHESRRIYDTRQSGRGNGGHTFGDALTESQRRAVIEYLKTL